MNVNVALPSINVSPTFKVNANANVSVGSYGNQDVSRVNQRLDNEAKLLDKIGGLNNEEE